MYRHQKALPVHALDQGHLAHHLSHLVGLQLADKMTGFAQVGVCLQVVPQLLLTVFSKELDGGLGAEAHQLCRLGFAGCTQGNFGRIPPGCPGCLRHPVADTGHPLLKGLQHA